MHEKLTPQPPAAASAQVSHLARLQDEKAHLVKQHDYLMHLDSTLSVSVFPKCVVLGEDSGNAAAVFAFDGKNVSTAQLQFSVKGQDAHLLAVGSVVGDAQALIKSTATSQIFLKSLNNLTSDPVEVKGLRFPSFAPIQLSSGEDGSLYVQQSCYTWSLKKEGNAWKVESIAPEMLPSQGLQTTDTSIVSDNGQRQVLATGESRPYTYTLARSGPQIGVQMLTQGHVADLFKFVDLTVPGGVAYKGYYRDTGNGFRFMQFKSTHGRDVFVPIIAEPEGALLKILERSEMGRQLQGLAEKSGLSNVKINEFSYAGHEDKARVVCAIGVRENGDVGISVWHIPQNLTSAQQAMFDAINRQEATLPQPLISQDGAASPGTFAQSLKKEFWWSQLLSA